MNDIDKLVQAIKEMNEHIENLHSRDWILSLNHATQDRSKLIDILGKILDVKA
jgi:hypothetical protein